MAKLLRLAREKEERERAQQEAETSATGGNPVEQALSSTSDSISYDQASHETIVRQTIPERSIPQETIVEKTVPQNTIISSLTEEEAVNHAHETKRPKKDGGRYKTQSAETATPKQTIVRQNIVDNSKGYYAVFNDISDRLIPELELDPYQQAVLQRLYRLSRGWRSEECEVGLGTLAKYCVMSRSQVQRSVAKLIEKGLIENLGNSKKGAKEGNRYRVLPGLKIIPRQTIPNETIAPESRAADTIVREEETNTRQNTVVSQSIVPRSTNKNSNKDLKNNTHTEQGGVGGSKFSLEECRRFAEHLQKTGQGINNPGGYATTIFRTGEFDTQIEAFLKSLAAPLETSSCPDCGGTGYYYPEGIEKGVKICKHDKLKETGQK
jgi:hypothetical protein